MKNLFVNAAKYRVHLPTAEKKHPWLRMLLDAYALIDAGMVADIAAQGRPPACSAGCSACCTGSHLPALPPEVMGLQLFMREIGPPEVIEQLKQRTPSSSQCFFLHEGKCSAYALRPIGCRRFIVFETPCAPGEEVTETRPDDVLAPSRHLLLEAFRYTLPIYDALKLRKGDQAGRDDIQFFLHHTVLMHQISWV